MKTCTKCYRRLYARDFYKMSNRKNFPDGRDCRCKECRRAEKRESYIRNFKKPDGRYRYSDGRIYEHSGTSVKLYWGEQKISDFKRLFPFKRNEDLTVIFDCSPRTIVRRARQYGLEKDPHWLQSVWDKNRLQAHFINKVQGNKADLTNFIRGGIPHRFKSCNNN